MILGIFLNFFGGGNNINEVNSIANDKQSNNNNLNNNISQNVSTVELQNPFLKNFNNI